MSNSLFDLAVNEEAVIAGYDTALETAYKNRLSQLGFSEGRRVECIQRPNLGAPTLFRVGSAVYSLDAETASKIVVKQE